MVVASERTTEVPTAGLEEMALVLWLPNCGGGLCAASYGDFGGLLQSRWSTGFGDGGSDVGGGFEVGFCLMGRVVQASLALLSSGSCGGSKVAPVAGEGLRALLMTTGGCGRLLLLGLLQLCLGLGFGYGLWAFTFYFFVLMDEGPAASSF